MNSDGLPPKRLLDNLDATNILEPRRIDRTDRPSRLVTESNWTTDTNEDTGGPICGIVLSFGRWVRPGDIISDRANGSDEFRSPRCDGESGR